MDVSARRSQDRTIEGRIVPWGETGLIQGQRYRFARGSLKRAGRRTPLLVDHNRAEPVGVLAELAETEEGVVARFSIDTTPAGDTALGPSRLGLARRALRGRRGRGVRALGGRHGDNSGPSRGGLASHARRV